MKIICEGPDGGGKTTWMENMVRGNPDNTIGSGKWERAGIPHGVPKTIDELNDRIDRQDEFLFHSGFRNSILDRYTPISQIVYDEVTGRALLLDHRTLYRRTEWCLSRGVILVYFRPSEGEQVLDDLIVKAHKSEEWIERVKREWPVIRDKYDEVLLTLRDRYTILVYDRFSLSKLELF